MHEAGIAMSVLEIAGQKCREAGYKAITEIRLRIGKASGVMPDSLLFAFNAMKADTIAKDAELLIDLVPLGGSCHACGKDFEADAGYVLCCPKCGSDSFSIKKGYEMEIIDMEVD